MRTLVHREPAGRAELLEAVQRRSALPEADGTSVTERLLDACEVAERLGVPVSWVRESARSGAIPCVRLGRYVRFDLADVDEWLAKCKQPGRTIAMRGRRVA